jgi:hypothetical protein
MLENGRVHAGMILGNLNEGGRRVNGKDRFGIRG